MFPGESIRIEKSLEQKDGVDVYFISRWVGEKRFEAYRPMTKDEIAMSVAHFLSGFEPPRSLVRLDKLVD